MIVDRFKQAVLVLSLQTGDYVECELASNQDHTSPLLPGLRVPLAECFSESNR